MCIEAVYEFVQSLALCNFVELSLEKSGPRTKGEGRRGA